MFKLTTSVMGSIDRNNRPMPPMLPPLPVRPRPAADLPGPSEDKGGEQVVDSSACACDECDAVIKPLDANRYATKKTIAQGMLDIALLTANASQLKYVLTIGQQHQFYSLMISLITVSIVLQIIQAIISIVLSSAYNINKKHDQSSANVWNNIALSLIIVTVAINVVISAFDMRETDGILPVHVGRNGSGGNATSLIARLFGF